MEGVGGDDEEERRGKEMRDPSGNDRPSEVNLDDGGSLHLAASRAARSNVDGPHRVCLPPLPHLVHLLLLRRSARPRKQWASLEVGVLLCS